MSLFSRVVYLFDCLLLSESSAVCVCGSVCLFVCIFVSLFPPSDASVLVFSACESGSLEAIFFDVLASRHHFHCASGFEDCQSSAVYFSFMCFVDLRALRSPV